MLTLLLALFPRQVCFVGAFLLFLLPAYLFAGVYLGNRDASGWMLVVGLAAALAIIPALLWVKSSPWTPEAGSGDDAKAP